MKPYSTIAIACLLILLTSPCLNAQSITWQRTLDTIPNSIFRRTIESPGNIYAAIGSGVSIASGGPTKMMFVKFDQFGNILAQSFFDTSDTDVYDGYWIENAYGAGYIIAGAGEGLNGDAYLVRSDENGRVLWQRTFGGLELDQARCIKKDGDNGYILLVTTFSLSAEADILVIRTDSLGNQIWSTVIGLPNSIDVAREIEVTPEGGFILIGTRVTMGVDSMYLVKLSNSGNIAWERTYRVMRASEGKSIEQTGDSGFLLGGICDSSQNNMRSILIRVDSIGNVIWTRTYTTNFNEWCKSIRVINDGRFAMCGMSDSTDLGFERAIVRICDLKNGNIFLERYFWGSVWTYTQNSFESVELLSNRGFVLSGFADFGATRAFVVKTDSLLQVTPVGINHSGDSLGNPAYLTATPNPFNGNTVISFYTHERSNMEIQLFDLSGRQVYQNSFYSDRIGLNRFRLDLNESQLPSGIYFCRLISGASPEMRILKLAYLK